MKWRYIPIIVIGLLLLFFTFWIITDTQIGHIQINRYDDWADAAKHSEDGTPFTDDLDDDTGKVWVISIHREVDMGFLVPGVGSGQVTDGASFYISTRNNHIFGMRTGPHIME